MTCSLFSYICMKMMEHNSHKDINSVELIGALWKYKHINNHNKFMDFHAYITSDPASIFLYDKDKFIDTFCNIQKNYHAILKLKNMVKYKYYKKFDNDEDLIGDSLNDMKDKHKVRIIESNTIYTLSLRDLLKAINLSLLHNDDFFMESKYPINPFTGLHLSKQNLYNIYFAYKNTSFKVQMPFEHFFTCEFNLKHYMHYSEGLVNSDIINANVRNIDNDTFIIWTKQMFIRHNKNPPIFSDQFPRTIIRKIFTPYIELSMYIKYGQDKNRVFWSKKLLKQQIIRFSKYMKNHNPAFGRVIRKFNWSPTGKRMPGFKEVIMDDHVRWDSHFPYMHENKKLYDFMDLGEAYFSLEINENNIGDNDTIVDDTIVDDTIVDDTIVDDDDDDTIVDDDDDDTIVDDDDDDELYDSDGNIIYHPPLPIHSHDRWNNYIHQLRPESRFNFFSDFGNENIIDASGNENIIDASGNENIIDNHDGLQNHINSNLRIIAEIQSNTVIDGILGRLIQLRLVNGNNPSPDGGAYDLVNELIATQLKIVAGKMLITYFGNLLTGNMRDRILDGFIGIEPESSIHTTIVDNIHEFYNNITLQPDISTDADIPPTDADIPPTDTDTDADTPSTDVSNNEF